MNHVLVTGAGGFIGGHLVRRLREDGVGRIRAVDCKPKDEWYQVFDDVENVHADLQLLDACREATDGVDTVFNLAADMGGMGFIENNKALCMLSVLVSTHVLVAAREAGVERLFYSSSACVYAAEKQVSPEVVPLAEPDAYPAMPEDGYGWEKLFSERMARHFLEDFGIQTRVGRYHNVYGPEGTWEGGREKAPAAICRKVATAALTGDQTIEIWGDGEQTRSFTYIDDCLEGTLRLTASDVSEPLNIGSDQLVTINQLVDIVEGIAGVTARAELQARRPAGRPWPQQRQHPDPRPAGLGPVDQPRRRPRRHLRLGPRPGGRRPAHLTSSRRAVMQQFGSEPAGAGSLRVCVLWTRLSGYLSASLHALAELDVDLLVVHEAAADDAPFDDEVLTEGFRSVGWTGRPDAHAVDELIDAFDPEVLVVNSWHVGAYRRAARRRRGRALRIVTVHNQWTATPKQVVARVAAPVLLRPTYDAAFVCDERQAVFAEKLGFPAERMLWGVNTCDHGAFAAVASQRGEVLPPPGVPLRGTAGRGQGDRRARGGVRALPGAGG